MEIKASKHLCNQKKTRKITLWKRVKIGSESKNLPFQPHQLRHVWSWQLTLGFVELLYLRPCKAFLLTKVLFCLKLFSSTLLLLATLDASLFKIADAFANVGRCSKSWCQQEFRNPFSAGPQESSSFGWPPLVKTKSVSIFILYSAYGFSILSISHTTIANEYMSAEYPISAEANGHHEFT